MVLRLVCRRVLSVTSSLLTLRAVFRMGGEVGVLVFRLSFLVEGAQGSFMSIFFRRLAMSRVGISNRVRLRRFLASRIFLVVYRVAIPRDFRLIGRVVYGYVRP